MNNVEEKLKLFKSFIAAATDEQKETLLFALFHITMHSGDTNIYSQRDAIELAQEIKDEGDDRPLFEIAQDYTKPYCTNSGELLC